MPLALTEIGRDPLAVVVPSVRLTGRLLRHSTTASVLGRVLDPQFVLLGLRYRPRFMLDYVPYGWLEVPQLSKHVLGW